MRAVTSVKSPSEGRTKSQLLDYGRQVSSFLEKRLNPNALARCQYLSRILDTGTTDLIQADATLKIHEESGKIRKYPLISPQ